MTEKVDKLERGEFIEFVKGLILNSEQYKRDNESDSYVIALDSAWGTGKSYFIDLLTQSATDDTLRIVKYNAWKNDYCENAFEPLIYDILTSDCLSFSMENEADAENVQKMISHIGKIGLAMGKQLLFSAAKDKFGIDVEKAFAEAKDTDKPFKNFLLRQSQELAEINNERESFEKFKQFLEQSTSYLKDNNQKLVVVIDELDRCKPTFAIQTLEVVKHLFDVNNIVFLFAVDIQQLSHSISSVYGQGFDSVGYLCRFFDYIAKMPEPNIGKYILDNISSIEALAEMSDLSVYHADRERPFYEILQCFVHQIYLEFNFSLRDLDTVIQSYKIMVNNFLINYDDVSAHMIYIFFLSLKYKFPELFSTIFIDKSPDSNYMENTIYKKFKNSFNKIPSVKVAMSFVANKEPLSECKFDVPKGNYYPFKIIKPVNKFCLQVVFPSSNRWDSSVNQISFAGSNISNILFAPDFFNWDAIKTMTYREYIHKQLEMYNFFNIETEDE